MSFFKWKLQGYILFNSIYYGGWGGGGGGGGEGRGGGKLKGWFRGGKKTRNSIKNGVKGLKMYLKGGDDRNVQYIPQETYQIPLI